MKVSERLMIDLSEGSETISLSILKKTSNVATWLWQSVLSSVCHLVPFGSGVGKWGMWLGSCRMSVLSFLIVNSVVGRRREVLITGMNICACGKIC